MSRCAGMAETTGHRCRAHPIHGTAWCVYHHPFHNAVEAIGGPWDGDRIAGHMAASISTPYGARNTPLDYDHIEVLRDQYASDHVDTRFVKIYEDGVPTGVSSFVIGNSSF